MHALTGLPDHVAKVIESAVITEFATVSSAGVPIDTPLCFFHNNGLRSLDVATGLAYPAKAERARRNPKTGLLIEGGPGEPIISIAGLSAVRDSDLQANVDRYVSEVAWDIPMGAPWSLAGKAVWYWTRILIFVTPKRILWWDNAEAMDGPPNRWDAPTDMVYPTSDPAPPGKVSEPAQWRQYPWKPFAENFLANGVGGHLTLCDDEGYPLPIRARKIELVDDGFRMDIPAGAPWRREGKATLSFVGAATFIGDVTANGPDTMFKVERVLPILPIVEDPNELWEPSENTRAEFMRRLTHETARRGQPIPTPPAELPEFTEGARARRANVDRFRQSEAEVVS